MAQVNAGRVRFVSRGEYSNSTQYYLFDLVNYNGSSYVAIANTTGVLPTDTNKWQLIAEKGNIGPIGPTGNGILSVEVVAETSSEKTLRINFTNGTYFDFTLENGEVTQAQLDEVIERDNRILANTPKGSTNTNPATMNDSADLPLNKFVLDGKTEQESTNGYQLLGLNDTAGTTNGVNYNVSNGIIKLTGTNTNTTTHNLFQQNSNLPTFEAGETYTIILYGVDVAKDYCQINYTNGTNVNALVSTQNYNIKTFTVPDDYQNTTLLIVNARGTSTTHNEEIKIMLVKGSYTIENAPAWEKYTGGIPAPNPSYPQEIKNVEPKNKIDTNKNPDFLYTSTSYERNGYNIIVKNNIGTNPEYAFVEYYIDGLKPNKKYTISFDAKIKTNGTISADVLNKRNDAGSSSTRLLRLDGTSTSQRLVGTFTTPNDTSILSLNLYSLRGTEYSNAQVEYSNIQIEEGEIATEYVPYGCIGIKKVNKNLFNVNNIDYGYINSSGAFVQSNNNVVSHNYIPVQPNENYVISANTSMSGMVVTFFNENYNYLERNYYSNKTSQSFTITNQDARFIKVIFDKGSTDMHDIKDTLDLMLEKGTAKTDYVANQEKTYNFPLSEGQFLAEDGTIENKVVNARKQLVLNGTEEYTVGNTLNNNIGIRLDLSDIPTNTDNEIIVISNYFLGQTPNDVIGNGTTGVSSLRIAGSHGIYFRVPTTICTTAEQFKTYVAGLYSSGNPLIVQYKLATPDETNFTPEQQAVINEIIKDGTYKEVTHFTAEASLNPDMEIGYYKDLEIWINNLLNS